MRIIAITQKGAELGGRIANKFDDSTLYLPEKLRYVGFGAKNTKFFESLEDVIKEGFVQKEPLLFIMASGIVVRLL